MTGRAGALPCTVADSPDEKRVPAACFQCGTPSAGPAPASEAPWTVGVLPHRPDGAPRAPGDPGMSTMDFWYERAIYELADLNEEATKLRREAATTLPTPASEPADQEEE